MTEEELFHAVLALPLGERPAFLEQACDGKPELRTALEALLAAYEASGSFFNSPLQGAIQAVVVHESQDGSSEAKGNGATAESESVREEAVPFEQRGTTDYRRDAAVGAVIGDRFILQEKIGEGGMGEVWVAKQTEPVKRKVALKVIKAGMDSRAVLQRFEHERQALAMMDHPNIARILDGGMTPTGHPYFVMELVNGAPLHKFCDEMRLPVQERLELFVPICQAVQHAHQKGVVHRDLKPANILVTMVDGRPVPKVIDFGVAKAISGKLTEETMSTGFGTVVGTLEYMSPEQAGFSSADIDTRSDIYSLGVILYELLTGLKPFDSKRLRQAALTEMIRIIREEEPSKPSTRLSTEASLPSLAALRQTEPKKLKSLMRGELDWVVMKCLEKQRDRRYETANGLARDVQRCLADEVVEARPPSAGYRLQKFLRRNRAPAIAAMLVLMALVAGICGTTWGLLEAQHQEEIARGETIKKDEARKAADVRAKGERVAKLRAVAKEKEALESFKIAEAQRIRADRHFQLARKAVEDYLVQVTEDELLKQSDFHELRKRLLEMATPFYEQFLREPGIDRPIRKEQARAAGRLGEIRFETGQTEKALSDLESALVTWTELRKEEPQNLDIGVGITASFERIGRIQLALGHHKEAEEAMRSRIAENEKLLVDHHDNLGLRHSLATGHADLAKLQMETGRLEQAKDSLIKSLQLDQELSAQFADKIEFQLAAATTNHNLGFLYWQLGNRAEAEKANQECLAAFRKMKERFPTNAEVRGKFAGTLDHLGAYYAQTGRLALAEQHFKEGLAEYKSLTDDFPKVPQYRQEWAGCLANLATALAELKRPNEAESFIVEAISIYDAIVEEFPSRSDFRQELAYFLSNRSALLLQANKLEEAESTCNRAVTIQEALVRRSPELHDNYAHLSKSLVSLGMILESRGKLLSARDTYRQALHHQQTALKKKPDHPAFQKWLKVNRDCLAQCCNVLAWNMATHPEAAKRSGKEAVANATEACEATDWKNWQYIDTLACAYAESGDFENAIKWQKAAIKELPWLNLLNRPELQARLELFNQHEPFRDKTLARPEAEPGTTPPKTTDSP